MDNIDSKAKALLIARTLTERKAQDVVIMQMQQFCSITDYFVICSGTSTRQVRSLAEDLITELDKQGISSLHIEGKEYALWVLVDYSDVVVHIFYDQTRQFYSLETLWGNAPRVLSLQRQK